MKFLVKLETKLRNWINNKISFFSVASTTNTSRYNTLPIAKLDSGATQTYIKQQHQHLLLQQLQLHNGPVAMLPNETSIQASTVGKLPLHHSLSNKAQQAYMFPKLTNESLISVGQICDDDCVVIFTKNDVKILKQDKIIIQGHRSPIDKLYDINLTNQKQENTTQSPTKQNINYIIRKDKTSTTLAQYLHACAFSPSISTFTQAIRNGNFITWPGIETINFDKILGTPLATAQGHLDNERKIYNPPHSSYNIQKIYLKKSIKEQRTNLHSSQMLKNSLRLLLKHTWISLGGSLTCQVGVISI